MTVIKIKFQWFLIRKLRWTIIEPYVILHHQHSDMSESRCDRKTLSAFHCDLSPLQAAGLKFTSPRIVSIMCHEHFLPKRMNKLFNTRLWERTCMSCSNTHSKWHLGRRSRSDIDSVRWRTPRWRQRIHRPQHTPPAVVFSRLLTNKHNKANSYVVWQEARCVRHQRHRVRANGKFKSCISTSLI